MGCSDSMARMLEETDPAFRERNDYNILVDREIRRQSELLCQWGDELFAGRIPAATKFKIIGRPIQNTYVDADDSVASEFGVEPYAKKLSETAMASDSISAFIDGSGDGQYFFQWLKSHWESDLSYLEARNARHRNELPSRQGKKLQKRIDALSVDQPAADLIKQKISWLDSKC